MAPVDIVPAFLGVCPEMMTVWRAYLAFWVDASARGIYSDLNVIGDYIVDRYELGDLSDLPAAFAMLERCLSEGDDETIDVVIIGIIDSIQTVASNRPFGNEVFEHWLGPRSRIAWLIGTATWCCEFSLADMLREHLRSASDTSLIPDWNKIQNVKLRGIAERLYPVGDHPDLARLRGIVAPEILAAAEVASRTLRDAGVPHALAGGLAVGAYGYPSSTTAEVTFLVGDEAFIKHAGGVVTLKVPLIAVGNVRVDFVSIEPVPGEAERLRPAVDNPPWSERIPIVPLTALVYMKLKASRQKDLADLVELLKRGKIEIPVIDQYLAEHAPAYMEKWQRTKEQASREE